MPRLEVKYTLPSASLCATIDVVGTNGGAERKHADRTFDERFVKEIPYHRPVTEDVIASHRQ